MRGKKPVNLRGRGCIRKPAWDVIHLRVADLDATERFYTDVRF